MKAPRLDWARSQELDKFLEEKRIPVQAFLQKAQGWCGRIAESVNERLEMSRQDWVEITRIALRVLLPFIAVLFSIIVFPRKVVAITLLPTIASVLFLSAFYGIEEQASCQDHGGLSLSRIPKPSSRVFSGKEEESSSSGKEEEI